MAFIMCYIEQLYSHLYRVYKFITTILLTKYYRPIYPALADSTTSELSEEGIEEYQQVMNRLKRKSVDSNVNTVKRTDKKSAFISNDEVLNDDWLENDLGHVKSKKRKMNPLDSLSASATSSSGSRDLETSRNINSSQKKSRAISKSILQVLQSD